MRVGLDNHTIVSPIDGHRHHQAHRGRRAGRARGQHRRDRRLRSHPGGDRRARGAALPDQGRDARARSCSMRIRASAIAASAVEIGKRVDRAKATVKVKVKFVDPMEGVLPDMSARMSFLSQEVSDRSHQGDAEEGGSVRRAWPSATAARSSSWSTDGPCTVTPVEARSRVRRRLRARRRAQTPGRASSASPRGSSPTASASRKKEAHEHRKRDRRIQTERGRPKVQPSSSCKGSARSTTAARSRSACSTAQPRCARGLVRGADGPVGLRQVDAAQPDRRARSPDRGHRRSSPATTLDTMSDGDAREVPSADTSASSSRRTT